MVNPQDLLNRLIPYADENGRFNPDVTIMRVRLYAQSPDTKCEDIDDALLELACAQEMGIYPSRGRQGEWFGYLHNWLEIKRPKYSRTSYVSPTEEVNDWALRRSIPIALKMIIYTRDKHTCQLCNRPLFGKGDYHLDHIVPVSYGGRATEENLRLLCASCNLSRNRTIDWTSVIWDG